MKIQQTKTDRRVKKTKRAIKSALAELLTEKDIIQITIKELAERADINRNTFYGHYQSIDDVIVEIENDIMNTLEDIINNVDYIKIKYNPHILLETLTKQINADFEFYSQLIKSNSSSNLILKLKSALKEKIIKALEQTTHSDKQTLDIVVEFACSGTLSVYQEWFSAPGNMSLENISQKISNLFIACIDCIENIDI